MAAILCDSLPDGILSVFPDDICCKILSCLTLKRRATASLVSKKWHQMITSLDDRKFVQKYSDKISCGYCFRLNITSCQCGDINNADPIIKVAADNMSFKELYLFVRNFTYSASTEILDSRLLTVLHIKGNCNMNFIGEFSEMPSLKEICFESVRISSQKLTRFIQSCPSICELTLIHCDSLCYFILPDQKQLKKVHVNCRKRNRIEVKARNLQEFHLCSSSLATPNLDLSACSKLQVLNIDCTVIPDPFPQEVCSAFPCIESLSLRLCKGLNTIKIVSTQLESLALIDMADLDDVFIHSPNLHSFKLIDAFKFQKSFAMVDSQLIDVEMGMKYAGATNRLLELRTFAEKLGESVTVSLATDTTEAKEVRFYPGNLQPLCIKHINLVIHSSSEPRYESFLAELFGYFHPRTLLVTVNSDALKHNFIKVLLNELESWNRECTKRYKCSSYMSWRNVLKGFTVLEKPTLERQERAAWCGSSPLRTGSGKGPDHKGLFYIALPNFSTITRQGAHQISFEFQWYK